MRLVIACSTIAEVWRHRGTFRQPAVSKYGLCLSGSRCTSGVCAVGPSHLVKARESPQRHVAAGTGGPVRPWPRGSRHVEEGTVKIEPDAVLVCSTCGVEGQHRLLYLQDRMRASPCENCAAVQMFTGRLYADYARDVAERGVRLPCNLAGRALRNPLEVFGWPFKG